MTVEAVPSYACNLGCPYCYQHDIRDGGNDELEYDLDAMLAALEGVEGAFSLFGGEPLLLPVADLERLWAAGLERHGANSIQTNGTLVTDQHLELFERYRVSVGISVDGWDELNDSRWAGSLERTREMTARTEQTIRRLCEAGQPPGLITTLHRGNASPRRLPRLLAWFRELDALGVRSVRLHLLEVDHPDVERAWRLTDEENLAAMRAARDLDLEHLSFDVFDTLRRLLLADDGAASCVWHACDPLTTAAVQAVKGDGELTNCGRTATGGVSWTKAPEVGRERQVLLWHTPQEHGGCKGCRFFLQCKGQCPGTGLDGDWRNRTADCQVWFGLLEDAERELMRDGQVPFSVVPERHELEELAVAAWGQGAEFSLAGLVAAHEGDGLAQLAAGRHGGHHADVAHGDRTDLGVAAIRPQTDAGPRRVPPPQDGKEVQGAANVAGGAGRFQRVGG